MPSVGRGMKLPPICYVALPRAYYDELPAHVHTLSGVGRGQQLQELTGVNSTLEVPGHRVFPADDVPECSSFEVLASSDDEFPELESRNREDLVTPQEKPVNKPEKPKASLKALGAQFAAAK